MKKNLLIMLIVGVIIASATTRSFTHSYGPAANNVNISGVNCTQSGCHTSYKLNSGTGGVQVSVKGQSKPYYYQLDSSYTINVTVTQSSAKKFGFQCAMVDNTTSYKQAGKDSAFQSNTQVISDKNRYYVEHNTADSTRHFSFIWKAPHTGTSIVRAYACGNGANGDGYPTGDYIYSTIDTLNYKATSTDIYNVVFAKPMLRCYNSTVHIILPAHYTASNNLVIYDMYGRCVFTTTLLSDRDINVSALPAGAYIAAFVNSNGGEAVSTVKFVKSL